MLTRRIKVGLVNKYLMICVMALGLLSCSKSSLKPADYTAWVEDEDSGLTAGKDLDDYKFSLLYKPVDYVLAKELASGALNRADLDKRKKELGGMQYFTLKITAKSSRELLSADIASEDEYYQRLEYFMSYMPSDLYLVDGKDTLPCLLHHFERNYGLAPYNTFVLGFENKSKALNDKLFVYDDKVLGTGKIMMKLSAGDLDKVPAINWN